MTGKTVPLPTVRQSKSKRAGIDFPVARVIRKMRAHPGMERFRISAGGGVFFSAVMEYLCAEILELSGMACKGVKKRRITPRHVLLAIGNDEELHELLKNVTIPGAGVIPYVNPALLKKGTSGGNNGQVERL
eukprot:sb/3474947/